MTHGLFMSTKRMTGFTHGHLPLVSDYLWVLSAQQDSLVSIYHSSCITHEYKSAWQELLASILNSSVIASKQCTSHVTWAQHARYLQIFSRHEAFLVFFYKLGCELYCKFLIEISSMLYKIIKSSRPLRLISISPQEGYIVNNNVRMS